MEHLTPKTLARLVDEPPRSDEEEHLERCSRCRDAVEALKEQTAALSHLTDLRPPREGWESLEARLRAEGLVAGATQGSGNPGSSPTPWLFRIAAGVVLLATGAALGAGLTGPEQRSTNNADPVAAVDAPAELTLDEAAERVQMAEERYLQALVDYRARLAGDDGELEGVDPARRWAALETLMAAGQAAVREAPTDPFVNGLLVNMYAEREATLRGMEAETAAGHWY